MATQATPSFLQPFTRVTPSPEISVPVVIDSGSFDDFDLEHLPRSYRTTTADADTFAVTLGATTTLATVSPAAAAGQTLLTAVGMTGQEESNWCWAAVTQAVRGWAKSTDTQTGIATAHIKASGRAMACTAPNAATSTGQSCAAGGHCQGECNDQHILSVVLAENGRLKTKTQAPPSFRYLASLLDGGSPVPCRVQWTPAGGHFILVVGWTTDAAGNQSVHVLDPATAPAGSAIGRKIWRYADFINRYSTAGSTGTINFSYEVQ